MSLIVALPCFKHLIYKSCSLTVWIKLGFSTSSNIGNITFGMFLFMDVQGRGVNSLINAIFKRKKIMVNWKFYSGLDEHLRC